MFLHARRCNLNMFYSLATCKRGKNKCRGSTNKKRKTICYNDETFIPKSRFSVTALLYTYKAFVLFSSFAFRAIPSPLLPVIRDFSSPEVVPVQFHATSPLPTVIPVPPDLPDFPLTRASNLQLYSRRNYHTFSSYSVGVSLI